MTQFISYYSSDYKSFESFISPFRLIKNIDTKKEKTLANIIDQANDCENNKNIHEKSYYIPNDSINTFFKQLNNMSNINNGKYCFSETQKETHNGIFIDIDHLSDKKERTYNESSLKLLIKNYIYSLLDSIESTMYNNLLFHVYVLHKPELEYIQEKNQYKEGYHIIIPNLCINKASRKYLLRKLKDKFGDDIDMGSSSVPSLFYGCLKSTSIHNNKKKYEIKNSYTISISYIDGRYDLDMKDFIIPDNFNFSKELSLSFEGDIIKNIIINLNVNLENESIDMFKPDDSFFENDMIINTVEILIQKDSNANYLYKLLDMMQEQYCDSRNTWWCILCGIHNFSLKKKYKNYYFLIAEWFSKKSDKYSEKNFKEQWLSIEKSCESCCSPVTIGTIRKYAKESNKEKYLLVESSNNVNIIKSMISQSNFILQHNTLAKILYNLMNNVWVYSNTCDKKTQSWFFYVNEYDKKYCSDGGQLYKWVELNTCTVPISTYISDELTKLFTQVVEDINSDIQKLQIDNNKSVMDLENLKDFKNKLTKINSNLLNVTYKSSIIKECELVFSNAEFLNYLDKNEQCLGVNNGVVILPRDKNDDIKFVDYYCPELYVKSFTSIKYIPYDEDNIYVKKIYKILNDIIPEPDALDYILTYLSTALSNMTKEPLIFLLKGSGSNGKSTILEFMSNVMCSMYSKKLNLGILTETRESPQSANSAFMDLKDIRFGYFSEPNKTESINTGRLKEILGNEKLTGRQLYGKQENFENKCVMLSAANYDFKINCNDHGIWRRIKYYECKCRFTDNPDPKNKYEKKSDKKLQTDLIKDENYKEAFLSILIKYFNNYVNKYDKNLNSMHSKTITEETRKFRTRQDLVEKYISTNIIIKPQCDEIYNILLSDVALRYRRWYNNLMGTGNNNGVCLLEVQELIENSSLCNKIKIDEKTDTKYFNDICLLEDSKIN